MFLTFLAFTISLRYAYLAIINLCFSSNLMPSTIIFLTYLEWGILKLAEFVLKCLSVCINFNSYLKGLMSLQ